MGFRYLQFGNNTPETVTVQVNAFENLTVNVRVDDYKGKCIASATMKKGDREAVIKLNSSVIGKRAVYFQFLDTDKTNKSIAEFLRFTFD